MNRLLPFYMPKASSTVLGISLLWVVMLTVFCLITAPARSQDVLWGMAPYGGPNGGGTAFSLKSTGKDFTVHHAFSYDAHTPSESLIEGSDGDLYGMTSHGGDNNNGTIFKIDPNGTDFTVIKSFNYSTDGGFPVGSLTEGSDGYLYGMTNNGGNNDRGSGTIFKISPDGTDFTVLKSFNYFSDGALPKGSLIEGKDGFFYGMTPYGGENDSGTIFKIAPNGTDFTVFKHFNPSMDGANPQGSLVEGGDNYLYSMTSNGIFKIGTDGTGFTVLRRLNRASDGANPSGSLTKGSDGYLYGMTSSGGDNDQGSGTIFKVAPDGTGFRVIKSFNSSIDGAHPNGDLTEGSDGIFYGMTTYGGDNEYGNVLGSGTIFKIASDGTGFTVLKSFNRSTDGANPQGSLIIQKGNKPPLPEPTQVNFQSRWPTPPQGWIKDYGLAFGEKTVGGKALTYGWKRRDNGNAIDLSLAGAFPGNPGNGRHRPSPSDVLLATLMHMQGNHVKNFRGTPVESYWEMQVENGEYEVSVSVGDGSVYTFTDPESHSINVEGVAAITHFVPQGSQGSLTRFKQAKVKVIVSDGFLTLDADGGTNTKINYAIIQPLTTSAGETVAKQAAFLGESVEKGALKSYPNPFQDELSLDFAGLSGKITLTVMDLAGKPYYQAVGQLQGGVLSVDLSAAGLQTGVYFIKLQGEDGSSKVVRVVKK